jgi:ComF family protein
MKGILSALGEGILDLIYPSNIYCISCGNIIDDSRPYALCDACARSLKWANGRTCSRCGKILQEGYAPELCTDCLELEHVYERGYTCVEYGAAERDMLHRFKYKEEPYLGRKMAEIMYDRLCVEELLPDLILPVPMFGKKERTRGYNQAAVLASCLAKRMNVPCPSGLLVRSVETEAMSRLGALGRKKNIREVFSIPPSQAEMLENRAVLLIDDIYTTGSTADACARTLLEAGAATVYLFTFASGANLIRKE